MADRLVATTVGQVCKVFDGPHATPTRLDSGPVFLGITSLNKGRIDIASSDRVSEEDFVKWTRRVTPQPGDVVFSYETKLGEAAIVPEGLRCCLGRRMGLMRPDPQKLDGRFLLYYYIGPEFQEVIRERTIHGSTVDRIALIEFPDFPLRIPPLAEQRAIAAVLGALDDKIELNRRMNATLEAMARALFQSWFVDFDPVRAKQEGRKPTGIDDATAALFPDSFRESELGEIPAGWETQPVGELVDCLGGGTPSTTEPRYWHGGKHHWTTPKDFSSLEAPILLNTDRKLTDEGIAKISSGLLPAGTLLLSSRAPVGYLAITAIPVAINQGFIAMKCNERASALFMLNWCKTNMAEIESRATGTTFAEISKQNFRPIRVVVPPERLTSVFTAKVTPVYAQITANLKQSRTLATLRDTLLPKLLSGELRVPDAERAISSVA